MKISNKMWDLIWGVDTGFYDSQTELLEKRIPAAIFGLSIEFKLPEADIYALRMEYALPDSVDINELVQDALRRFVEE